MYVKLGFAIFVVAAFLCFPTPLFQLGPFFSMLMTAYLASVVAAIIYFQSTMLSLTRTYIRVGRLHLRDKEYLLPIILAVLFVVFSSYNTLFHYNYGNIWMFPFFVLICFLFVFAEEMIIRNFIFYVLIEYKISVKKAIIICSVLFACMHTFRYMAQAGPWVMAYHFVFAFLIGIILSCMFVISRNVLFVTIMNFLVRLPIFGYALNNTILAGKQTNFLLQYQFVPTVASIIWFSLYLIIAILVARFYYRVVVRHYSGIARLSIQRIVYDPVSMKYLTNKYKRRQ
ncbi:MAG: CPBP family intramembrane glutamic endopeptidase [Ferruginibacter sp.]